MDNDPEKKKENNADKVISAVEILAKPISALASAATIGTFYAYYLGTRYFDSYYTTLGIPWISRSVATTDRLLFAVAPFVVFLAIFGAVMDGYAKGDFSIELIRKQIIFLLIASLLFYALHFGTKFFLKNYESYWWIAGVFFIFLALSACVSLSVILLSENRTTHLSEFIYIFIIIGLTTCAQAATEFGRIDAEIQLEKNFSSKPIAILHEKKSDCQWRAIQLLDSSKVVIVKPYKIPIYRVVNADEVVGNYKAEKENCKK